MTASKVRRQSLIKMWRRVLNHASALIVLVALAFVAIPLAQAQTFTVLHKFRGHGDGAFPTSGVIRDAKGNLYGVTEYGGSFSYGTLFSLDPSGIKIAHNFLGGEGLFPEGGLSLDSSGNLYGTAYDGGAYEKGGCTHGCGVLFERDATGNQTVLHAFTGKDDGGNPETTLIQDAAGNLYGVTFAGGIKSCFYGYGCGVIFKLDTANQYSVLYSFTDMTDGKFPAGLVADGAGNLYTTTYDGGTYGYGAVLKLDPTGKLSVLYSFTGSTDGNDPTGSLLIDQEGNLYGTTFGVYANGLGSVYKLDPLGNITVLYSFTTPEGGEYPEGLVMEAAGNLYGVTLGGGTGTGCYYNSCGLIFKLDTGGNFTVLHTFTGGDGELPTNLTIDKAGNLYGTTLGGDGKGSLECSAYHGCGVVFKLTP
jgi:uncharacterized repeat protein (TIGR03803 family)